MGQARRRKLAGAYPANDRKLTRIVGVGFGGLCGECDEIHEPDLYPFLYTVGLTEQRRPELLLIVPIVPELRSYGAAGAQVLAEEMSRRLTEIAEFQQRRGKVFDDGEHIHGHEFKTPDRGCIKLMMIDPPHDAFPLGEATQRYGKDGYRVMQVLLHDRFHRAQDDPLCEIANPLRSRLHS